MYLTMQQANLWKTGRRWFNTVGVFTRHGMTIPMIKAEGMSILSVGSGIVYRAQLQQVYKPSREQALRDGNGHPIQNSFALNLIVLRGINKVFPLNQFISQNR